MAVPMQVDMVYLYHMLTLADGDHLNNLIDQMWKTVYMDRTTVLADDCPIVRKWAGMVTDQIVPKMVDVVAHMMVDFVRRLIDRMLDDSLNCNNLVDPLLADMVTDHMVMAVDSYQAVHLDNKPKIKILRFPFVLSSFYWEIE